MLDKRTDAVKNGFDRRVNLFQQWHCVSVVEGFAGILEP